MTTKPQSTTEPTRKTICENCGFALYQTADPNNIHWYHEGTGDVRCPTRFAKPVSASAAPVVDKGPCTKCGHFSTIDIHNEGECQVRGQSGFICGCKCEFAVTCLKCGHSAGVERTLKRCKARIDGGEALCQCHCVFPSATATAAPERAKCLDHE